MMRKSTCAAQISANLRHISVLDTFLEIKVRRFWAPLNPDPRLSYSVHHAWFSYIPIIWPTLARARVRVRRTLPSLNFPPVIIEFRRNHNIHLSIRQFAETDWMSRHRTVDRRSSQTCYSWLEMCILTRAKVARYRIIPQKRFRNRTRWQSCFSKYCRISPWVGKIVKDNPPSHWIQKHNFVILGQK